MDFPESNSPGGDKEEADRAIADWFHMRQSSFCIPQSTVPNIPLRALADGILPTQHHLLYQAAVYVSLGRPLSDPFIVTASLIPGSTT